MKFEIGPILQSDVIRKTMEILAFAEDDKLDQSEFKFENIIPVLINNILSSERITEKF